jgi:hypothetical protein
VDLEHHRNSALRRRDVDHALVSLRNRALFRHTKQLQPVPAECQANLLRTAGNETNILFAVEC